MAKSLSAPNPIALVTGASSGIGAEFALTLADAGYDLILVVRRENKLKYVQAWIGSVHAEILVADLTTDAGMTAVADRIEREDRLDFLVNNAGFGTQGMFWDLPVEGQMKMHRLHVLATVRLTHAALPGMVRRNRGHVVNVSSVAGFGQTPGNVSYCATKTWMNSFTEGLWLELKKKAPGVRIQALCPGFTRSEFHEAADVDVRGIPESLWTSTGTVVKASIRGLSRDSLFVVPGWQYRTWVALQKALPRQLLQAISSRSQKKFKRAKHG